MKTHLLLLLIVFFGISNLKSLAQIDTQEAYKSTYNQNIHKEYSPLAAGLISYLIPGGGQFYCNENVRGLKFLGAYALGTGMVLKGLIDNVGNYELSATTGTLLIGGVLTMVTSSVWSIVDAIKLAQRKNIEHSLGLGLSPNLQNAKRPILGLAYSISF